MLVKKGTILRSWDSQPQTLHSDQCLRSGWMAGCLELLLEYLVSGCVSWPCSPIYFVSMVLPILNISYKWNHTAKKKEREFPLSHTFANTWYGHSFFFFFFLNLNYFFIFFWLCWVFVSVRGLSLVVASGGHSSSRCAGLSCCRAQAPDAQAQ